MQARPIKAKFTGSMNSPVGSPDGAVDRDGNNARRGASQEARRAASQEARRAASLRRGRGASARGAGEAGLARAARGYGARIGIAGVLGLVGLLAIARRADAQADGAGEAKAGAAASTSTKIDWARGLVTAKGVGVAGRHAPSPVAARGPARRAAEDAARKQLAAAVPALPLAEGGTLAGKLADAATKARVDRAIDAALTVDAELSTDGSWKVTLGVPIEALRQALTGPRASGPAREGASGSSGASGAAESEGPPVVVIEGAATAPAIGYKLGALAAPTIWVKDLPPWAKSAPRIKARGAKAGALQLDDPKGSASTLFVIVAPPAT